MHELNVPYVKMYDEKGLLVNPINGSYLNNGPNRRQRKNRMPAFKGNKKGISLTISGNLKYARVIQEVKNASGKVVNVLFHYLKR